MKQLLFGADLCQAWQTLGVKAIQLREYQAELIENIKNELRRGKRSICAVLGCGGGKSVIAGMICKSANDKGNRVLFLVHRQELCEQIELTFRECGVNFELTRVGMVQTITRHLTDEPDPQIIITDEAHHCLSRTYRNIYAAFPSAVLLGFTATPVRMNEGGLGEVFDSLVESVTTRWLIDNNYLAPYRYYSVKLADTKGIKTTAGDYNQAQLAELMEKPTIYGDTITNYIKFADGKKTIVYCASVKASRETCEAFNDAGIRAAHLDGTTPAAERDKTVESFRNGGITVLCNVDLFGEGFDVPDCECVVLLRPTKSLTLHIQQSMRSMRYKPGKVAIVIDHVGNVFQHGLPDAVREWTLETKRKTKREKNNVLIRECPRCYAVAEPRSEYCPVCGEAFKKTPREIAQEEAELTEITQANIAKLPYTDYKKITTFTDLQAFQRAKKYKFGWTLYKAQELNIPIPRKYQYARRFYDRA